jgi:tRNA 2-thiouridine synthesizing protein A
MNAKEVDLSGLPCPIPIIMAHRYMSTLSAEEVLVVTATDPLADQDFQDYCRSSGHTLLRVDRQGQSMTFYLQKRGHEQG